MKKNHEITDREKKLEKIIYDLVQKVRLCHAEYGSKYLGGHAFQFIVHEIEELGIDIEE